MQDKLEHLLDDRVRMTAAVAHDMRTSLTRLRLRAESLPDEEIRIRTIADIDDMQKMIEMVCSNN